MCGLCCVLCHTCLGTAAPCSVKGPLVLCLGILALSYCHLKWHCRRPAQVHKAILQQHDHSGSSLATRRAESALPHFSGHRLESWKRPCGARAGARITVVSRERSNTSAPSNGPVARSSSFAPYFEAFWVSRFGLCARELLFASQPHLWTSSVQPCNSLRCNQVAGIWPCVGSRTSPEQRPQALSGHLCL